MRSILSSIEPIINIISKITGTTIKFCFGLGAVIAVSYFLRIDYYPQGLSLSDSLLFLVVAGCFGAVYTVFVIAMVSLGISMAWLFKPLLELFYWLVLKLAKLAKPKQKIQEKKERYQFARFNIWAVPFGAIGVLFIFMLTRNNNLIFINLFLMTFVLYLFYSLALAANARYIELEQTVANDLYKPNIVLITTADKESTQIKLVKLREYKHNYFISIGIIVLAPLFISQSIGQLIDGGMRLAQLRIEHPILHVKAPYSQILPQALEIKNATSPQGFTPYEKVTILFHGVGNAIVVSFEDESNQRQMEIPKDHVIIERRSHIDVKK